MMDSFPNLVVTFLIEYESSFLVICRSNTEENFPGLWAFPGGKVEIGETVVDTIRREVAEETNLLLSNEFVLLDAYCFGKSTGLAFLLRAQHGHVTTEDAAEYRWVKSLEELAALPRIPGIDNHLLRALQALQANHWQLLEDIQLTSDRYINKQPENMGNNPIKKLIINTDGGSRGNPGPAGIGVVIRDESENIIFEHGAYIGETTNNVAEYSALIKAVETARDLGATHLDIRMDSELIVKQMKGQYKIKEPGLQQLAAQVLRLRNGFESVIFTHVRREYNKDADRMVNQALDALQK